MGFIIPCIVVLIMVVGGPGAPLPVLKSPFAFAGLAQLPSCPTQFSVAYDSSRGATMAMNDCSNTTVVTSLVSLQHEEACYFYSLPQKCFCAPFPSPSLPPVIWSATNVSQVTLAGAVCYNGVWNQVVPEGATPFVAFCFVGQRLSGAVLTLGSTQVAASIQSPTTNPSFGIPSYC